MGGGFISGYDDFIGSPVLVRSIGYPSDYDDFAWLTSSWYFSIVESLR